MINLDYENIALVCDIFEKNIFDYGDPNVLIKIAQGCFRP